MKALHRLIVTSATYRQARRPAPALVARDPENRLLARGPRFRLQAEVVRDNALAIAGSLVTRIGGPSIKPYQPAGLWEELAGGAGEGPYVQDKGAKLYGRSLYVYRKRTVPAPRDGHVRRPQPRDLPGQAAADQHAAPGSRALERCHLCRGRPQLAELVLERGGSSPEQRIGFAFRRALGRMPTPRELDVLRRGFERYRKDFEADKEAALKLSAMAKPARSENRPGRAGRLHRDRQRHPQPGRDDHTRVTRSIRGHVMNALQLAQQVNRRLFLRSSGMSLGAMALGSLLDRDAKGRGRRSPGQCRCRIRRRPAGPAAFPSQGQAGDLPVPVGRTLAAGPVRSQATLRDKKGIELPDSVRMGQRITTMTSGQKHFPVAPSIFKFAQHGQSGAWLSELLAAHGHDRR